MKDDALLRYSRHILLDEIGVDGQEKLLAARVLIIGAGGLGSPAALYLASAGVGQLTLCDGDTVDLTNLQRQILHDTPSIGLPKVVSGQRRLAQVNPEVDVVTIAQRVAEAELEELVAAHDLVLDCCDNFATRHAVNRACVQHKRPLVSGAAIRFDGQVAVFDARRGDSPCYQCLFGEGQELEETRCATMGVFAPLVGLVGSIQAAEAMKLITGAGTPLVGKLLLIDARTMRFRELRLASDPTCPVCGAPGGPPP
ncbi:sulfur carrier protein ThiS adenylyltransferase [Burkholderiales bacterium]|nr:MAG: molybdopterin-synthase adenylyltransferase MoeB [Burkholderiales bacterium]CAG0955041.1 sulfur carrier protein ThiS adenylyltransferase [Burkholderiales bacterium]